MVVSIGVLLAKLYTGHYESELLLQSILYRNVSKAVPACKGGWPIMTVCTFTVERMRGRGKRLLINVCRLLHIFWAVLVNINGSLAELY